MEFFREDYVSRYRGHGTYHDPASAASIERSARLQTLDDTLRTRALLIMFRSKFQMALCSQYHGFENSVIHDATDDDAKWLNPRVQIQYASLRQASTIASRTAFESLMEFVHFVEERRLLSNARSKIGSFMKWCIKQQPLYGWFVFYLISLYKFDRALRTPEIHGMSAMAVDALRCPIWPYSDNELDAINIGHNIWGAVLQTLNNQKVNSWFCKPDETYMNQFKHWESMDLEALWKAQIGPGETGSA